jgi:hypothetical protein
MDILEQTIWGNAAAAWLLALAAAVFTFLVLNVLKHILSRRLLAWTIRTETDLDDLIVDLVSRTRYLFLVAIAIYVGSLILALPQVEPGLRTVMVIVFLVQAGLWGNGLIDYLVSRQVKEQREKDDATAAATINALGFVGKVTLWAVADRQPGCRRRCRRARCTEYPGRPVRLPLHHPRSAVCRRRLHHRRRVRGSGGAHRPQEHARSQPRRRTGHLL